MTDGMKKCCACGVEKPLSEFHNQAHTHDGKHPRCKPCAMYGPPVELGVHDLDFSPYDPDLEPTRRVEQLVARFGKEAAIIKIKLERFAT